MIKRKNGFLKVVVIVHIGLLVFVFASFVAMAAVQRFQGI